MKSTIKLLPVIIYYKINYSFKPLQGHLQPTTQRDLQRGSVLPIPHHRIRQPVRQRVHRTAGGHPHVPQPYPPRPVLHQRLRSSLHHLNQTWRVAEFGYKLCGDVAFHNVRVCCDRWEEFEVGGHAEEAGGCEGVVEAVEGLSTCWGVHH